MIYAGYKKGFLAGVLNLVYTILSIIIAWFLSPVFASMFPIIKENNAGIINAIVNVNEIINSAIYFIIIFLLLRLIHFFLMIILKSFNNLPIIGSINKVLGSFIGFINASIVVLALSLLFTLPIFKNSKDIINNTLFKYSNNLTKYITNEIFTHIFVDKIDIDVDSYRQDFKEWLNKYINE